MKCVLLTGLLALLAIAQQPPANQTPAPATDPKELANLSGRCVGPAGQGLKKTVLTLRPSTSGMGLAGTAPAHVYTATSDAEGKFVMEAIPPGRYQLWAERPGYLRLAYGARASGSQGTILVLSAGQSMSDLVFQLTPQAVISGKVLDEDGDPVAHARISVMRQSYMNGKRQMMARGGASSDENGDYKVPSLAPGRYYLSAAPQPSMFGGEVAVRAQKSDKPEEDVVTTYYPGVTDQASASPVEVTAGHDIPGIDIRLRKSPVVRIKGKVAGSIPGQPVERMRITLMSPQERFMGFVGPGTANPGKDGSFELAHVQPGSYTLVATTAMGVLKVLARQSLEVGNQNMEGVVLTLQPLTQLRGTVKTEGQPKTDPAQSAAANPAPTPVIHVALQAADGLMFNSANATVNDDGTFVLSDISPGKYTVSAYGNVPGSYLKSIHYGNQDVLQSGIDLSQGGDGALEVILSMDGGEVDGSVRVEEQKPAQNGTVTLVPDPPDPERRLAYMTTAVDQNGQFTLKAVRPGKYRVYAWEELEPGAQFDPDFMKPHDSLAARVTVAENGKEQVTLTRISLTATASAVAARP